MKKLLSLLIICAVSVMSYMPFVSAYFDTHDVSVWEEKSTVSYSECCEWWQQELEYTSKFILCNDGWICPDGSICECCMSPFSDYQYSVRWDNSFSKQKIKKSLLIDFTFIDLFESNLYIKHISHSSFPQANHILSIENDSYISLTGSVKSNC